MQQPMLVQAIQSLAPMANYPRDFTVNANGLEAWMLEDVPHPTEIQVQMAYDQLVATQASNKQQATALRQAVVTQAQSAVGLSLAALTPAQVRALLALMLWERGAITADGKVASLDWMKQ